MATTLNNMATTLDKMSLAQAARWIETRAGALGESARGMISLASLDALHDALKSGKVGASGCIDGRRRVSISADEWIDYDLVLRHAIFPKTHFVNSAGTPVVEAISKCLYPAGALNLHHRRSNFRLPSAGFETDEPGYHQAIVDVFVSARDVLTNWPASGKLASALPPSGRRIRTHPARESAAAAIAQIYPEGVPEQVAEPNAALCKKVAAKLKGGLHEMISDDTILRAAGRRRD